MKYRVINAYLDRRAGVLRSPGETVELDRDAAARLAAAKCVDPEPIREIERAVRVADEDAVAPASKRRKKEVKDGEGALPGADAE